METRKVQLSGGTTYTVSLPKAWAQEHSIEAGALVSLHPNDDGSLLVELTSSDRIEQRSVTVDIGHTDTEALQEQLVALYTVGVDAVVLRDPSGHDRDRRMAIESAIGGMSGFELLESTDTRIRVVNLIGADNVDIRKTALRLRLVILSIHRDAMTAIATADTTLADRVIQRDDEADKLFLMVTRHFRRALLDLREVELLGESRERLFEYYYVCRQFERIADHAVKIARFVVSGETRVPATLIEEHHRHSEQALAIVDSAADVVLAGADVSMAHGALRDAEELAATIDASDRDLYEHEDPDSAYIIGLFLDSLRRTADYGANIAEIGVQQHLRTQMD